MNEKEYLEKMLLLNTISEKIKKHPDWSGDAISVISESVSLAGKEIVKKNNILDLIFTYCNGNGDSKKFNEVYNSMSDEVIDTFKHLTTTN